MASNTDVVKKTTITCCIMSLSLCLYVCCKQTYISKPDLVYNARRQQSLRTVELVDHTYDGRRVVTLFWEKVNGCRAILLLLILYNILVSVNELFAKDRKYDDMACRGTSRGHHQQFWEV